MVHFLRDPKNRTIIETEVWNKDSDNWNGPYTEISSTVDIKNYSIFLLQAPDEDKGNIIQLIADLDELGGWLWEVYFSSDKNDGSKKEEVEKRIGEFYKMTGEALKLGYVKD